MGVSTNEWLYWCRLCARDDAIIKVRAQDEDLVRIISKCFDVEMTLEEPELGSMLCEECYSVIGQLITFSESVNKVQAVFELLRHTEPQDNLDVDDLRREYGLTATCKQEMEFLELNFQEDKCSSVEEQDLSDHSITPSPNLQDRSRPRHKLAVETKRETEEVYTPIHSNASSPEIQPKRARRKDNLNQHEYRLDEEDMHEEDEVFNLSEGETTELQPVKRKRGRPRGSFKRQKLNDSKIVTPPKRIVKRQPAKNLTTASVLEGVSESYCPSNDYNCKACNESFMSFMALRRHKHDMHGGPKKFVCDYCGKALKTFTSLVEHQLVHTDEKPCVCPVCNAGFKNKARLRVHSQTHGEPKFACEICGKRLQTRAILNKHKYVHSEERRFKCEVCGSGCKNSTALKIHLLGHTGLRPYVCKYCGKAFASNTNCRSHKWKKHPNEVSKEDESESSRVPVPTLEELRAITHEMAKTNKEV
ncbi:zinc finger protein weckle [Drosophila ficusphila]|uniref:zinc finger protein weckle n=1 Tax=Drosophila ficusphila TaxID=30025 RepID=UPI001C8AA1A9|nr:zinc finger protein weckle [Drosophila ficusphila]